MTKEELKSSIFIGIVEDNKDPKKLGRIKVRVINVFDEIPKEDIPWASPWKDLNGNQFILPEVGKVVSIVFDQGNKYKPEYIYAEHFNINLENKLKSLSDDDYVSMRALMFDNSTQIYRNNSDGLKIDHEYSNINLDKNGNILLNLRDTSSVVTLGSSNAEESAVLGDSFMKWFDTLVDNLLNAPYLGNIGAPVVTQPNLISCLTQYKGLRDNFLSDHVFISKNGAIIGQGREAINQTGDNYKSSNNMANLSKTNNNTYTPNSDYVPTDVESNPASREKYDPSKGAGNKNPPTPFKGTATQQQKDAIKRAVDYTLAKGETSGKCARGSFCESYNYVAALRNTKLTIGMSLSAGGNAKDSGYHDSLKKLGYSMQDKGVISKSKLIEYLDMDYDIGDVVVYWGMDKSSGSYARYGHTQIFTGGFQSNSNGYKWSTDNRRNYSSNFVYGRKDCDKWTLKVFKAPKK